MGYSRSWKWGLERAFVGLFVFAWLGCGSSGPVARTDPQYGVLLMAHGGEEEWDLAVMAAAEELGRKYPVEVAFGMADPKTIQTGVERLEALGVERIGVVRLFVSGDSWYERTEQILGLAEGATERPDAAGSSDAAAPPGHGGQGEGHGSHGSGHGAHGGGAPFAAPWRIETRAHFALAREGLSEAEEMDEVLLARARRLSADPGREDVLILAHGPGDDGENERWIANIKARTGLLRQRIPFRRVEVMTLREDWENKREAAEEAIRAFVRRASDEGGTAIVIPFRVHGFGPYREVLAELEYRADETGLLPHDAVVDWIERQAVELEKEPFRSPLP